MIRSHNRSLALYTRLSLSNTPWGSRPRVFLVPGPMDRILYNVYRLSLQIGIKRSLSVAWRLACVRGPVVDVLMPPWPPMDRWERGACTGAGGQSIMSPAEIVTGPRHFD